MATQIIRPGGSVKGYTWNKCYRIDLIRKHNLKFDETISIMEDQYFNLKYLEKAQGSFFIVLNLYITTSSVMTV
ncbi:hypothetical protein [Holzapfeliella floricola]|uniref:hypothetical protein n=1 Tax=Holzapfeliella floricola TaxID=679249 RepID=UPI0007847ADF|nr:hypothetical protein [Holzapfeliella floricola]